MQPVMQVRLATATLAAALIVWSAALGGCRERTGEQASGTATVPAQDAPVESRTSPTATAYGEAPQVTELAAPYPYPPSVIFPTQAYPGGTPTEWVWTPESTFTPRPTETPLPPTITPPPTVDVAEFSVQGVREMAVWREVAGDYPYPVIQISDTPLGVDGVAWSPDGRRLLLNVALGEVYPIFPEAKTTTIVLSPDDGAWLVGSMGNSLCATSNEWSADGTKLAFIREYEVWIANADGSEARALVSGPDSFPYQLTWSPEGERLAVLVSQREENDWFSNLWLYDLTSGAQQLLVEDTGGGGGLSWSPGGDAVAHLGIVPDSALAPATARLWIAEATPSGAARVVFADLDEVPATEGCLSKPQWALNGEKLLATVLLQQGVWLVERNGDVQRLPSEGEERAETFSSFSLSRDGRYVAYTDGAESITRAGLIYDLVTESIVTHTLPTAAQGVWSPVAPQLAFDAGPGSVAVLDVWNNTARVIDPGSQEPGAGIASASWSPDGSHLAYWRQERGGRSLWLSSLEGEPVRLMYEPAVHWTQRNPIYHYDIKPQWRPDGSAVAVVALLENQPEAYLIELP